MKPGDLVQFKCIGAGKWDNPPYSGDGTWRIGTLFEIERKTMLHIDKIVKILYKNKIIRCPMQQVRLYENW